jgi:hypothetical protein
MITKAKGLIFNYKRPINVFSIIFIYPIHQCYGIKYPQSNEQCQPVN